MSYSLAGKRVWVAGHRGMVGSALVGRLRNEDCEIVTAEKFELELLNQYAVRCWIEAVRPDAIFLAAARVGGILFNSERPADFLYENLVIETNIIQAAATLDVEKLLFLGSSCIYPKLADQPIREEALLTGPLEATNEWYAIAKIAGIKLCQAFRRQHGCDFISAMPTNLYGPHDNFDLQTSHVLPALIRKAHEAKLVDAPEIEVWGSGTPRREFLHVDDCAEALVFLMQNYSGESHVNVGCGEDISIAELSKLVADEIGFQGELRFDPSKPDGTPQKLLDIGKLSAMGWSPQIKLRDGIRQTYEWYLSNPA